MTLFQHFDIRRILIGIVLATGPMWAYSQPPAMDSDAVFPSRTVRIVTAQAGNFSDTLARLLAERLAKMWNVPVIVENLAGAGGAIAADAVAKSRADGYTLLVAGQSNLVLARSVGRDLRYDTLKDFAPIGRLAEVPFMLAVNKSLPINSIPDLITYASANPGKLSYGSNGPGTLSQMSVEMLTYMTGTKMLAIPYRGAASAVIDVVAGRVDLMLTDYPLLGPHVRSGALRLIAAAGPRRLAAQPDIPTIDEQGVSGYAVGAWYGLLTPAGTSAVVMTKLTHALDAVRRNTDLREKIVQIGGDPVDDTPAQFRAWIAAELDRYSEIARRAGIKID